MLLYLARQPDRLCSIAEIARAYGVSQNHLMKVINDLVNAGWLTSAVMLGVGLWEGRIRRAVRAPSADH